MPGTSGSCRLRSRLTVAVQPSRAACPYAAGASTGFTLIELLVVLVLLALMAGVAVPLTWRQIDAARLRDAMRTIEAIASGLPAEAYQEGRALEIDAAALQARMPSWPAEWRLDVSPPLRYGPDGVAQGASITVFTPSGPVMRWRVEPYTGRLRAEVSR